MTMTTTVRSQSPFLSTFPGRYYYDPTLFEQEQERIFSTMWYFVARADALPDPGSYMVATVGKESILVVRDKVGRLHAFYNVCRHRGARLCSQISGRLKGSIQCRYHAWTYGLDGRLIGAPNVMSNEQFDPLQYGLLPVALHVWEGLIFVNLSDHPAPFEQQLHDPATVSFAGEAPYERYQISRLKVGQTITYDVRANWKLIVENTLECYHCGPMHPELCSLIPMYRTAQLYVDGEASSGAALSDAMEAFTLSGKSTRPTLPGLLPEDARRYHSFLLLPNVFVNLLSDYVAIDTFQPLAPDLTRVTTDWLFDPDALAAPGFDSTDTVALLDLVNKQDWEVCEITQQSMTSRTFANGGNYAPDEHHIRYFVDFVLAKLA